MPETGNRQYQGSNSCFICQKYSYVQIFFRRETISDDFEIINDKKMLEVLERLYDIKGNE